MITQEELGVIKATVEEFLAKMTVIGFTLQATSPASDAVDLRIDLAEPQFLIGQDGKTLLDLQRLLKIVLHKKLGKVFYVKLDINEYNTKKTEHVKKMASQAADQVSLTGISKTLPPMSSYERRIVHAELAGRSDVTTESQGEGESRSVVIMPR